MSSSDYVLLPRGANLLLDVTWTDQFGVPINLTSLTLTPFEISPASLQSSVSVNITNPTAGQFRITCPWSSSWPSGTGLNSLVTLRVQASNGSYLSEPIPVMLQ